MHGSQAQSAQLMQFSQAGSQVPSPQAGSQTPDRQFCVHGTHPQSPGQVLQFSPQAGSHVPLPQFGVHVPLIQV